MCENKVCLLIMSWNAFNTTYIIRIGVIFISINVVTFVKLIINIIPLFLHSTVVPIDIIHYTRLALASGFILINVGFVLIYTGEAGGSILVMRASSAHPRTVSCHRQVCHKVATIAQFILHTAANVATAMCGSYVQQTSKEASSKS